MTGDQISWSRGAQIAFMDYLKKRNLQHLFEICAIGIGNIETIKRRDIVVSLLFNKLYKNKFQDRINNIQKKSQKETHIAVQMDETGNINLRSVFEEILKKSGHAKEKNLHFIENPHT
jgi:hypothetical protein